MNPRALPIPADLAEHVERLRRLPADPRPALRNLFDLNSPIYAARAPGRLDVMGGIADYSGSLVLQLPIAEAAIAAVQCVSEPGIAIVSLPQLASEPIREFAPEAKQWHELWRADYGRARDALASNPDTGWAAYVLGPILVLLRETAATLDGGLRVLIDSRVPEGKGVSSSAAVEVATLRAVAAALHQTLDGENLARLGQLAENCVVGAPCGIMDQMTSAVGQDAKLLALRCQPAIVEGHVTVPDGVAFWGIDSGVRHAVSGSDYVSVRTGAFMGYRIIVETAGLKATSARDSGGYVTINDPLWHGYLANVSPAEFNERFATIVPVQISGQEFLARYGGTTDTVTRVDPERTYAVRAPTRHPIEEHARVTRFRQLLTGGATEQALDEMGELMFASHESYSACGLGSAGTDVLVELVRERGLGRGLYGAKITGGGSGGTVSILGRADRTALVEEIAKEYSSRSGRETYIFRGSSPGACATEVVQITID